MRWATWMLLLVIGACSDLRDFRGSWQGGRIGEAPELRVGAGDTAALTIDELDAHGMLGRLTIAGLVDAGSVVSLPGAEADALASLTFAGSPVRIYLAFVAVDDGGGDATALIALYDDRRVELRLLRGGTRPLYSIFTLTPA